jgi:hypothetical protein
MIDINNFAKDRHLPNSEHSHFEGTWQELIDLTREHFDNHKQGYRDGVIIVTVPPTNFKSGIVKLNEDSTLTSTFKPRRKGEDPYIQTTAEGSKMDAHSVEIILYHKDVLAEDNDRSTEEDWEIVSINASATEGPTPMSPTARARNILNLEGGTDAKLEEKSKDELVAMIKEMAGDIIFWGTHAKVKSSS